MNPKKEVTRAILSALPEATLGQYNKLVARPGQRINIEFGLRNHAVLNTGTGARRETIIFYVIKVASNVDAPPEPLFEQEIVLRPDQFLVRTEHACEPEKLGQLLLEKAQNALERYLIRHPEAAFPTEQGQMGAEKS